MNLFLDSSALVKRYIEEEGTARVLALCADAAEITVSIICIPEVLSASNRCLREKKISSPQYNWIKNTFLREIGDFTVIDLSDSVLGKTILCLEKGALRSLDALHIASASVHECDVFLSSDKRQKDIAEGMGLTVEIV